MENGWSEAAGAVCAVLSESKKKKSTKDDIYIYINMRVHQCNPTFTKLSSFMIWLKYYISIICWNTSLNRKHGRHD